MSPAEGHFAHARLAEKPRDPREAEAEYRKALDAVSGDVGGILDLSQFLSNHGRYDESERLFEKAQQAEPDSAHVVFAHAAVSKRNLHEAQRLLRQYASFAAPPDDPPQPNVARLCRELQ